MVTPPVFYTQPEGNNREDQKMDPQDDHNMERIEIQFYIGYQFLQFTAFIIPVAKMLVIILQPHRIIEFFKHGRIGSIVATFLGTF